MLRQAAALLLVVAGAAVAAPPPAATPARVVVHKDTVTAALERVPVATVIAAIVEQTGAELRGGAPASREVTLELHDAPFEEALERILGEQSFTLTYEGDGRLKRIALGEPPPAPPGRPGTSATSGPLPPASPNDEVIDATRRLAEFVQSEPTVAVGGRLAKALGTDTTTLTQLLGAALKHEDAHVRAEARRATIKTLAADSEVRAALVTTIDGMTDDAIVRGLRGAAGADAERLATALARHGRSPVLARRMQRALSQLRAPTGEPQ